MAPKYLFNFLQGHSESFMKPHFFWTCRQWGGGASKSKCGLRSGSWVEPRLDEQVAAVMDELSELNLLLPHRPVIFFSM